MKWTTTAEGKELVKEIAKEVIAETAPEEMILFDEFLQGYYQDPNPLDSKADTSDDALGFGVDSGLLSILTPTVFAVVTEVINYFRDEVIKSAGEEGTISIRAKIKDILNPAASGAVEAIGKEQIAENDRSHESVINKEQLLMIQRIARREAKKYDLNEEEAGKLANTLIGLLALA